VACVVTLAIVFFKFKIKMINRKVNEVDRIEKCKKIGAVVVVTENITCCPDKTEWPGICLMFGLCD